jgi:hypothetical protein
MDIAKWALLDRLSYLPKGDQRGSLACLSARFALEFNADAEHDESGWNQKKRNNVPSSNKRS